MRLSELSLPEIERQLRDTQDEAALERWSGELLRDARVGARDLGERWARRLARRREERARVTRLFALRDRLARAGLTPVAGVDEVGMGPLAGPVVAAAVVLSGRVELPGLRDSKQLTRAARERLDRAIRAQADQVGVGVVEPGEIDRLNIYHAGLEAMRRAVVGLSTLPQHLLVDARTIPGVGVSQTALVRGDCTDGSIAAASIVAKVHRDSLMCRLEERHPGYGFAQHMGYGTPQHLQALRSLGPSSEHRRSFAPVAALVRP